MAKGKLFLHVRPPARKHTGIQAKGETASGEERLYDNELEAGYGAYLEAIRQAGKILHWWPKPFKIRLARACFYEADFLVQRLDGTLEIHETKGFMMEDAQIKLKMLTKDYPFRVLVVRRKKGGIWEWETYEP